MDFIMTFALSYTHMWLRNKSRVVDVSSESGRPEVEIGESKNQKTDSWCKLHRTYNRNLGNRKEQGGDLRQMRRKEDIKIVAGKTRFKLHELGRSGRN